MLNYNEPIIAIAGTVGVGKSTLADKLGEKLDLKVMHEEVIDNPYLKKYYDDFEKWGFHLQIFFLAERFKKQKEIFSYQKGFIMDRSIYEDLEIFAKMNFENKTMSNDDWNTYKNLFESMILSPYFEKPDLLIYLEGDIKKIISRIKTRNRKMEINTDESYWLNLYERYNKWINNFNYTKVLKININDYDINNDESIDKIVTKINNLLNI